MLSVMEEQQQLQQQLGQSVPKELMKGLQQLRQLKGVLQDQIHQVNDETQQVKGLKPLVRVATTRLWLISTKQPRECM